ncbi:MAG TPA: hypothetical protein VI643_01340, partial [Planctomycetota bacterium]|nr:hypothetical protein [Planctomycetota bacterium]
AARRALAEFGQKVKPLLVERLRQLKALEVYHFIEEVERNEMIPVGSAPELEGIDPALKWYATIPKQLQPQSRKSADQYLLGKLYDAFRAAVRGEYDYSERILGAIQTLDPAWRDREVGELLRHVQSKIVEGRVLRPTATPAKPVVKLGDPIEVELKIANPFETSLTLGQNGVVKPVIHVQATAAFLHFSGEEEGAKYPELAPFPEKLVLDPGQAWTQTVKLPTASEHNPALMRVYTIYFATSDIRIETKVGAMARKIHFPTVTVKVVPAKYEKYLADPLQSLAETMKGEGVDGGLVEEVFICLLLLPDGEQLWRGVARMMANFEKATESVCGTYLIPMLTRVTANRPGVTKDAWLKWWAEKKKALATQYPLVEEFK